MKIRAKPEHKTMRIMLISVSPGSCLMCWRKSYDDPAVRDKRATGKAKDMISEYLREEVMPYEGNDLEKAE